MYYLPASGQSSRGSAEGSRRLWSWRHRLFRSGFAVLWCGITILAFGKVGDSKPRTGRLRLAPRRETG